MSRRRDRFPRAGSLHRGYRRRQVDDVLARVEASDQGAFPPVRAAEIRRAGFDLVRRGYDTAAVDLALDQLEEAAMGRETVHPGRHGRTDPSAEAASGAAADRLRDDLTAPCRARLPRTRRLRRGYHIEAVDDVLDRVATALDGGPGLALDDVRFARFRSQRRGYDQAAADDFLDRVIDLILMLPTAGAPGAARQAAAPEVDGPAHKQPAPGSH